MYGQDQLNQALATSLCCVNHFVDFFMEIKELGDNDRRYLSDCLNSHPTVRYLSSFNFKSEDKSWYEVGSKHEASNDFVRYDKLFFIET